MAITSNIADPERFEFNEADFKLLMQKRIQRVLLICSNYDAYMLEEDGHIDEQIFNEYSSLNLRLPPNFVHTDSATRAFEILNSEPIDLVIEMLNIPDIDTFALANQIKAGHPAIPIVVLTHFSREVSIRLKNEDLSAIDNIFCWLGNADLLLAIIKLLEDRMNAEHDVQCVGVQTILLVEDSIRFTSVYLPNLYKIVFWQSREFIKEAMNVHQQMLRRRGRPKILLARTYQEALEIYEKYKHNMLGIISDICIKEAPHMPEKTNGGIRLCQQARNDDPFMPFVFQSSDLGNARIAKEMGVEFIHKYSETLSLDLQKHIVSNFGFGDFIFRDPATMQEIDRASDLASLHRLMLNVPDNSFSFHASRNEISKWLNARSLFPIGKIFKQLRINDFKNLNDARQYIYKAIGNYRFSRVHGVIADFPSENFDEYFEFSRIGQGSVGGKARGLVFLSSIIKKYKFFSSLPSIEISIPKSVVLTIDIFDQFMEANDLYKVALSNLNDENILAHFVAAQLPVNITENLRAFVKLIKKPIAIRSSSKLEDSQYQPFAGIYSTYMIPVDNAHPEQTLENLTNAIKAVYASAYYRNSKAYIAATSNLIDEEKMAIILQEVCGNQYGNRFYPALSGVARSLNFYPFGHEKAGDGVVKIGFGLGKYVVDGGISLRFSPRYPQNVLQLSSPAMALNETQKTFYALNLSPGRFTPSVDDSANLDHLSISEAEADNTLRFAASTYDFENNAIRSGVDFPGKRIITFPNILKYNTLPLADILRTLLEIGQREMGSPVEIEFAANLDVPSGTPVQFNLLQIRPFIINDQRQPFSLNQIKNSDCIIISQSALGNGVIENLYDLVYVKPHTFNPAETKRIAGDIEKINARFLAEKRNYILVGPGRWGSDDPWLGIPVKWPQISEARIIVESGLHNYRIDPSQGSHFFQNLTTFRVGYFTINPQNNKGFYDYQYLTSLKAFYEDDFIRHIRFEAPLNAYIDGKKNTGVILKPGKLL